MVGDVVQLGEFHADVLQVILCNGDEACLDGDLVWGLVKLLDDLLAETDVFACVFEDDDVAVTEDFEGGAFGAVRQDGS